MARRELTAAWILAGRYACESVIGATSVSVCCDTRPNNPELADLSAYQFFTNIIVVWITETQIYSGFLTHTSRSLPAFIHLSSPAPTPTPNLPHPLSPPHPTPPYPPNRLVRVLDWSDLRASLILPE